MRVTRADLTARALLTLGALLPYWRLLSFGVIFVTDDYFASDIFNGELPARVLVGRMIRHGQLPVWTDRLCSGVPLVGTAVDPVGVASFALLPPAPALDFLVIVLLLVAAHGAYSLARRFGADRVGSVLAGIAFAGSGYIACQLKHLGIVSTVVWLPLALSLLDRAMNVSSNEEGGSRAAALFGLVFANQGLSGFPQSAYICGLVYLAFALFRGIARREGRWHVAWPPLVRAGVAIALGAAAGAIVLLPLSALGGISDRADTTGWEWATRLAYWPPNVLSFLIPYAHGDISNNTYTGPPFFWEDYGYVGIVTVLLAFHGAFRERRRPPVTFAIALTLVSYLFVLGRATPVYRIAYLLIPGMSLFRFPTRFLIVVELGLAVLGAIGVTRLREDLRRWKLSARAAAGVAASLCVLTVVDLTYHQPRQNPMVPARDWLAAPEVVALIRADAGDPRTFTPRHRDLHRAAFQAAHGWADVAPYFALRDLLEPNVGGGLWNVPSADCYAGVSARWYVDVWGDHNRELSLMTLMSAYDARTGAPRVAAHAVDLLRGYGVTHLISPVPLQDAPLKPGVRAANVYLYRIDGASRAWFVSNVRAMNDADAAKRLLDPSFDPAAEVLLQDVADPGALPPATAGETHAPSAASASVVTSAGPDDITLEADAPENGYVVLADTFYPGWSADVDGRPAAIYRANLSIRAIPVGAGHHRIRLRYAPPGWRAGFAISLGSIALLLLWLAARSSGSYAGRRPG